MSWRIETADPLTLLRELPDGWTQTCFIRPPRELPVTTLLAILEEVHRVLREDGTLWIALPGRGNASLLIRSVQEAGWLAADTKTVLPKPTRGESFTVAPFSKQQTFHFDPHQSLRVWRADGRGLACSTSTTSRLGQSGRPVRRAWCVPADAGNGLPVRLVEWCILASTSPRACGVCGTPSKRVPSGSPSVKRWRGACSHTNSRGACLVLDPFCGRETLVGLAAVRLGRNYLGVEQNAELAIRARRRLSKVAGETKR